MPFLMFGWWQHDIYKIFRAAPLNYI